MNSFNVKTPDDWKEKLFAKTTDKKSVKIKIIWWKKQKINRCLSGNGLFFYSSVAII